MKRWLKRILITLSILIAILVVASWVLPKMYKENIRVKLENEIDRQVDAEVTFSEVKLTLFKHFPNLTLNLQNLCVVGNDVFKTDTLAAAKEIQLEVNLWSLIGKGEVEIKSINLYNPEINIYVLKDGRANYQITRQAAADSTSASTPSSVHVAIDNFRIHHGKVSYSDWKKNIFVLAVDVDHTGVGDFKKDVFDYQTETIIRELSFEDDHVQYLLKKTVGVDLVMEMNVPESKFTFKENQIQINHFVFSMEGFFQKVVDHFAMNVKFHTQETQFKNILSLLPGLYLKDFDHLDTQGEVAFSGLLDGIYSSADNDMPKFHFDLNVKNARVKIDSLPEAFNNIQLDLSLDNPEHVFDSTQIHIKKFHVELGKHPIDGSVEMQGIRKPKVNADIVADLELSALKRLLPIKGIDLRGKVNLELKTNGLLDYKNSIVPSCSLSLSVKEGYFKYDSLPRPISNISFHLNAESKDGKLPNTVLDFKKIHAEVDDNLLHGFARLKGYPDVEVDVDLDADMDLEDIEKIYPVKGYQLKGKFNLDLFAKGVYNKTKKKMPFIDAKLKLTDGSVQYKAYPHPIKDIHFAAEVTSKTGNLSDASVSVSRMTYILEDEPFEITGSVADFNNYQYSFTVNGKADLSKLSQVYPLEGIQLSGLIDAQIKTSGLISDLEKGNYTRVSSTGRINFNAINIKGVNVKKPVLINDAVLTFTPSKIFLTRFDAQLGKSKVTLAGDIGNYMAFATQAKDLITGNLTLTCDTLDINEWMPPAQTATGKPIPATDTTHKKTQLIEVPKNFHIVFDSKIDAVKYEDLEITKLDGDIVMKDGVLSLHETGFNTLNAQFSFSGNYDTRSIEHPLFDIDMDVKDLDINRAYREIKLFRDLAPSASKAFGKFSITYKLSGELKKDMQPKLETLRGGGVMRIADAKINGMKLFEEISKSAKKSEINDPHLTDFTMETEIRDSKIIVKPFSMKLAGFDADIEGVNTMSGMIDYIVKVELVPLTKIKIPFHVTGYYDKPKVALGKGHKLPY
ncbi:MAG: AsmA family protein [Bacteroidetes bacterium]|nr:AsmA family protein [Bacteroidota bacterium]MBS1539827.1 AsmA family protein [Bacteroidota bacterium]